MVVGLWPQWSFPQAGACQLCSAGSKLAGRSGVFYLGGVGEQDANPGPWLPSWRDQAGHTIQAAVCDIPEGSIKAYQMATGTALI